MTMIIIKNFSINTKQPDDFVSELDDLCRKYELTPAYFDYTFEE